jgi:hypothetical protein
MKFSPKIDKLIGFLLLIGPIGTMYTLFEIFTRNAAIPWLVMGFMFIFAFLFPLSILLNTHYTINGNVLLVRCSVFRWIIPINEIISIEPSEDLTSSAALTMKRLCLTYSNSKKVFISPKDEDSFIREINKRKAYQKNAPDR